MKMSDFKILELFVQRSAATPLTGITTSYIIKKLADVGIILSIAKIRYTIVSFYENGFIDFKFKEGNAKKYFITTKGIELYKSLSSEEV